MSFPSVPTFPTAPMFHAGPTFPVATFTPESGGGSDWILSGGTWDDFVFWRDTAFWED